MYKKKQLSNTSEAFCEPGDLLFQNGQYFSKKNILGQLHKIGSSAINLLNICVGLCFISKYCLADLARLNRILPVELQMIRIISYILQHRVSVVLRGDDRHHAVEHRRQGEGVIFDL